MSRVQPQEKPWFVRERLEAGAAQGGTSPVSRGRGQPLFFKRGTLNNNTRKAVE